MRNNLKLINSIGNKFLKFINCQFIGIRYRKKLISEHRYQQDWTFSFIQTNMLGPVDPLGGLVVIAPLRAGDPGSNPGPGENFFS